MAALETATLSVLHLSLSPSTGQTHIDFQRTRQGEDDLVVASMFQLMSTRAGIHTEVYGFRDRVLTYVPAKGPTSTTGWRRATARCGTVHQRSQGSEASNTAKHPLSTQKCCRVYVSLVMLTHCYI